MKIKTMFDMTATLADVPKRQYRMDVNMGAKGGYYPEGRISGYCSDLPIISLTTLRFI